MGYCEFCGKESNSLQKVRSAGSVMAACPKCMHLGKPVEVSSGQAHTFYRKKKQEDVKLEVVPNYASMINSSMGKRGISSKQLANTLNIKDTTLQKYLTNKVRMDVDTARRFENYFEIKLTQEAQETDTKEYMDDEKPSGNEDLSLGELLMKKLQEKK